MGRHLLNTLIATIILLTSCQQEQRPSDSNLKHSALINHVDSTKYLSTFDTAIVLKDIVSSKYQGPDLNDSIAKNALYKRFRQEGYLTSENLPDIDKLTKEDENNLSVDFTSIFKVDINHSNHVDAVITYWLTPPYASGHCWQPHKAIISDNDNGYQITNEEFIPDNYTIDSVWTVNGQSIILGYDYECANHRTLRNIEVRLTK